MSQSRYYWIQALRFFAALLVVVTHATLYTKERLDGSISIWSPGAVGVDIFFVISGYLMMIASAGLLELSDGWKYFMMRRVVRIAPMYWIATTVKLFALLAVPGVVLHAELDYVNVVLSYLFLPSENVDGRFEPLLGVGWTLIFEMFFYFLFGTALLLRVSSIKFVGSILGICILLSFYRQSEWPAATIYFSPIVVFFLIGMVFAVLVDRLQYRELIGVLFCVVVVTGLVVVFGENDINFKGKSISGVLIVATVVLLFIVAEPVLGKFVPKWLIFLGEASYVLYLFHPLIAPAVPVVMYKYGFILPTVSIVLCLLISVVVASFAHLLIERPLTRTLKKVVPYSGRYVTGR
jgi:peptidoglycan/LPS O-acetylase OafA/YrhL